MGHCLTQAKTSAPASERETFCSGAQHGLVAAPLPTAARKVEKPAEPDPAPKTKKDLEEDQRRYVEQHLD